MSVAAYAVRAEWDPEASVWTATSDDVPGLCAEAATLEELTAVVLDLVPELLVANGVVPAAGFCQVSRQTRAGALLIAAASREVTHHLVPIARFGARPDRTLQRR